MMGLKMTEVGDSLLAIQFQFQQNEEGHFLQPFCAHLGLGGTKNVKRIRTFFREPCLVQLKGKSDGKEPIFANPSEVK